MSRNPTLLALSTSLLALAVGCQSGSEYADLLPDDRLLIQLPAEGEASAKGLDADEDGAADFYEVTADVTRTVNGFVGAVLFTLDELVNEVPPSSIDAATHTATWGPWSRPLDAMETQVVVTLDPEARSATWAVEQWSKSDASGVIQVIHGEVDPGATREASSGRFTVDFDAMAALDPVKDDEGIFTVEYELRPDGAGGTASYVRTSDGAVASYGYDRVQGGDGRMELLVVDDATGDPSLVETLAIRSRWTWQGEGRSDVMLTGGDLADRVAHATQCWDASFSEVYWVDDFGGFPEEGDPAACAFSDASYAEDVSL